MTGALRTLHRLSLVDHSPAEAHQDVRVHQIVQRALRDPLHPDHRDLLARIAADALIAAWPDTERDAGLASALRANTTALIACAGGALHQPAVHWVLYRLGESLGQAGQLAAAIHHLQHLTNTATRYLGSDHPSTLVSRNDLARWRGQAGDTAEASEAASLLVTDHLRVLGPDHLNTLGARSNLAHWQGEAGNATGAAAAFAALLEDSLRVLGPDHARTLTTRSHLAHWQGKGEIHPGPLPRSPPCWSTTCGHWARTTPIPSTPVPATPTGSERQGTRGGRWRVRPPVEGLPSDTGPGPPPHPLHAAQLGGLARAGG